MAIVYRTDGAWGTGKGSNLEPAEVDGNFYDIDQRVTYWEDNPPLPIEPVSITITGYNFTMGLSNGETLGPVVMTMPVPDWRGTWTANTPYHDMDFFTAPDGGFGAVMQSHTSAATFDWAALGTNGLSNYRQIVGSSGGTVGVSDLIDVALAGLAAGDMLVWDAAAGYWRNLDPVEVAENFAVFGGDAGAGGTQGMVPAPAAGDGAAHKFLSASGTWVVPTTSGGGGSTSLAGLTDVSIVSPANLSLLQYSTADGKWHNQTLATLGAGTVGLVDTGPGLSGGPITTSGTVSLAAVSTLNLLANVTGATSVPSGVSVSTLLDAAIGTERGSLLRRGGTGWTAITPGADGTFLRSGGPAADITWGVPSGAGTVTSITTANGITGGPITTSGTVSLATIADSAVLGNISGATAPPTGTSVTLLLDHALGATQGQLLYRGATSWAALSPGTAGQLLRSGGTGANPSWTSSAGSGTVTTVNTTNGIIGGPITTSGTVSLATIGDTHILANVSGVTAAPTDTALSAVIDAAAGSARGSILYRGASAWAALSAGTAGDVLTTGGSGADPTWAAAGGGAITLTGDVTGSGTGSVATNIAANAVGTAEIANSAVSYAKVQNVTAARLLGNPTGSAAAPSEITLGTNLSFSGTTLNATGGGTTPTVTTKTTNYTVQASDLGNTLVLAGASLVLTLPAGIFTPGKFLQVSVTASVSWSVTNSTGLALAGLNSTTLQTGTSGTFVANADGTTLNFIPGMQTPTTVSLGGVNSLAATTNNFLTGLSAGGSFSRVQPSFANLSGTATVAQGGTGATSLPLNAAGAYALTNTILTTTGTATAPLSGAAGTVGSFAANSLVVLGAGFSAVLGLGRANGSFASPTALAANDIIGNIVWDGTIAGNWDAANRAGITVTATEAWTSTANGASMTFQTTPNGTVTTATRVTIQSGLVVGAPTGGDKGVGTINATTVYGNNVVLTSDSDLKHDIGDMPACLSLVQEVAPRSFVWDALAEPDGGPDDFAGRQRWGFIAQDFEGPVRADVNGEAGLDAGALIATLWQAVRELSAKVETLEDMLTGAAR